MQKGNNRKYYSKLIVAGEYLVLNGFNALAIPLDKYYGHWNYASEPDPRLIAYANFIETQQLDIDLIGFNKDIQDGLFFDSNIPNGYGGGSSGALVAAIYDTYFEKQEEFSLIKENMIRLESYFHGTSSGIDPLVSYLNKPLRIDQGKMSPITLDQKSLSNFYLVDSNTKRQTEPLVNAFKLKVKNKSYHKRIMELGALNNLLIDALIGGDKELIAKYMFKISESQFYLFDFAIPKHMRQRWEQGLKQGHFYKLCGAGGGGFFLVFSNKKTEDFISII